MKTKDVSRSKTKKVSSPVLSAANDSGEGNGTINAGCLVTAGRKAKGVHKLTALLGWVVAGVESSRILGGKKKKTTQH